MIIKIPILMQSFTITNSKKYTQASPIIYANSKAIKKQNIIFVNILCLSTSLTVKGTPRWV